MVEVVTQEDFNEFRKSLEEKLDILDKNISVLIKDIKETQRRSEAEVTELNKQIEDLSARDQQAILRTIDAFLSKP